MPLDEEGFIDRVSIRHSVSPDAVRTILRALRSGGGRMAQFSHSDFGGMSQWSPGMSMVGDMFNNSLKSKLEAFAPNWRLISLKLHQGTVTARRSRPAIVR
jgi:hypothetical protein